MRIAGTGLGAAALMALVTFLAFQRFRDQMLSGAHDFLSFYAGARLAGTPDLYNPQRTAEVQRDAAGVSHPALRFIRPPYYAGMLWPLARLPYRTAYLVWVLLGLASVAAFVILWRPPALEYTLLFTSFCLPVVTSLLNGQDVAFLLLWIAAAAVLWRSDRPFAAGLVLSLCAAKYHLFLLLPLLVVGQRAWRFGLGLAAGGALLLAASFAVAGPSWPAEYYAAVSDARVHPGGGHRMPNLHGLFYRWPLGSALEWVFAAGVVAAFWRIARRAPFLHALAACVAAGLLVGYHAWLADCALLLPAVLTVFATTPSPWLRITALFLLTPVGYFLLLLDSPAAMLVPLAMLALVGGMALEAGRQAPPAGTG